MKSSLAMRLTLALGLPAALARDLGRIRRLNRDLLARAGHEAGRGNVITAVVLVAVYLLAL